MHDILRRAADFNRQICTIKWIAALAILCASPQVMGATGSAEDPPYTSSIDRDAASEIRIQFVKTGREGIELSAKLVEGGGLIERPINWLVKKSGGETIYSGATPFADFVTEPGSYDVTAEYGSVKLQRQVTLIEGQRLGVSFVMNVGGLRVLPKLPVIGLPRLRAETRVYATSGEANGKLVALSTIPGEIVRLGAGSYRLESRFTPGNAEDAASIEIKPGIMSAIEMEMPAGLARLDAAARGEVTWNITSSEGEALPPIEGERAAVVLRPGSYEAAAIINGTKRVTQFSIASGETKDIILSP